MITIKNLSKVYGTQKTTLKALNNISVNLDEKGLIFILGKSGSGKTTFLNIIGGLDQPTSGEIIIDNQSLSFKENDLDAYRNTYIGFIFQEYNLIDEYSVGQNIALAMELQGKAASKEKIDSVLLELGLVNNNGETLYDRHINELSGGQKQRVAIARALIKKPKIILADEPTGALDSHSGKQLYDLLKKISMENLVIVVSHDVESAKLYGDRIIELSDGEIIKDTKLKYQDETLNGGMQLIKSRLPFARSFKMGATALKYKKARLLMTILLSVIAFSFFGFTFTASTMSSYRTELQLCYDHGIQNIMIESQNEYSGRAGTDIYPLTTEQLECIENFNSGIPLMGVQGQVNYLEHMPDGLLMEKKSNIYYNIGLKSSTLIGIDPTTGATDMGLFPDERFVDQTLCHLPQTDKEIAITDLKANMFMLFGYKEQNGSITSIKTPDDLIGKKLGNYKICGVYSTEIDVEYIKQFDHMTIEQLHNADTYNYNLIYQLANLGGTANITSAFVKNNYSSLDKPYRVFVRLSGNIEKDLDLFEHLNYEGDDDLLKSVDIVSIYSNLMYPQHVFQDYLVILFRIMAIIFALFAILLTMNFLNISMDLRKREIGILRALGADKKDIIRICLSESLIIAVIEYILSIGIIAVVCGIANTILMIPIFHFGILAIILTFVLCFGVVALSTIIPIFKITNKKPIDIINSK